MNDDAKTMAMFVHLSCLLNLLIFPAGYIVPILIWQLKKDEMPELEPHGKMILNFFLSMLIYTVVSGVLVLAVVGIFMLFALYVISIIFPIIGAVKAKEGIVWQYPLTITFIK